MVQNAMTPWDVNPDVIIHNSMSHGLLLIASFDVHFTVNMKMKSSVNQGTILLLLGATRHVTVDVGIKSKRDTTDVVQRPRNVVT